jgi:hypothetical protein
MCARVRTTEAHDTQVTNVRASRKYTSDRTLELTLSNSSTVTRLRSTPPWPAQTVYTGRALTPLSHLEALLVGTECDVIGVVIAHGDGGANASEHAHSTMCVMIAPRDATSTRATSEQT